ncbi:hypothetical protein LCGC14_2163400 [marine sediment metagenome]|uniref:ASCH domain-containing protein n=1 Tax=marine sediment metagenome TaxID=412755 RepID=A0A0F9EEA9_9ZZZZ
MRWMAFAWTLTPLLLGEKTATRRKWKDSYAARFKKGDLVAAYDRQPRFGGKRVALLKLTRDPYKESTAGLTEKDWFEEGMHVVEAEGGAVDGVHPKVFWQRWMWEPEDVWVVKFKLVGN